MKAISLNTCMGVELFNALLRFEVVRPLLMNKVVICQGCLDRWRLMNSHRSASEFIQIKVCLTEDCYDRNIQCRSSQLGWAQAQTAGPSLLVGLGLILFGFQFPLA